MKHVIVGKVIHIPWYATVFRGDKLEAALAEIAPLALRFGATEFHVYRDHFDRYKFLQVAAFENKLDFERYWNCQEFVDWRTRHSNWFQKPVVYEWQDLICEGSLEAEAVEA